MKNKIAEFLKELKSRFKIVFYPPYDKYDVIGIIGIILSLATAIMSFVYVFKSISRL